MIFFEVNLLSKIEAKSAQRCEFDVAVSTFWKTLWIWRIQPSRREFDVYNIFIVHRELNLLLIVNK